MHIYENTHTHIYIYICYLNHGAIALDKGLVEGFDILSSLLCGLVARKLHFLCDFHGLRAYNNVCSCVCIYIYIYIYICIYVYIYICIFVYVCMYIKRCASSMLNGIFA